MSSQMYDVWTDFPTYCRSLVDLLCSCSMRSMRSMRSMQFKAHFDCAVGARVLTLVCPQGSWLRWPRYGRRESWQSWQSCSRCVREYTFYAHCMRHMCHISHLIAQDFAELHSRTGQATHPWHQHDINLASIWHQYNALNTLQLSIGTSYEPWSQYITAVPWNIFDLLFPLQVLAWKIFLVSSLVDVRVAFLSRSGNEIWTQLEESNLEVQSIVRDPFLSRQLAWGWLSDFWIFLERSFATASHPNNIPYLFCKEKAGSLPKQRKNMLRIQICRDYGYDKSDWISKKKQMQRGKEPDMRRDISE